MKAEWTGCDVRMVRQGGGERVAGMRTVARPIYNPELSERRFSS